MTRKNYIPVRFSDRELEQIKEIGQHVDAPDTSKSIRYAIASTYYALETLKGDPLLKPGEAIIILPEKLVKEIEGLDMQGEVSFQDRLYALLMKWKID